MTASDSPAPSLPFVHLGARSEASQGISVARVEELCWEASRDEQGFLALTDVHSLGRAPAFAAEAARSGLRPVFGVELNVLPRGDSNYRGVTHRVRLLIEEVRGWRNAIRLINTAAVAASGSRPAHLTHEQLIGDLRGLVVVLRDELWNLVRGAEYEKVEALVNGIWERVSPGRLYIELPEPISDVSRKLAEQVEEVAKYFNTPTIAVPQVCAAHAPDDVVQRVFSSQRPIGASRSLNEFLPKSEQRTHLLTRAQASARYTGYEDALKRTLELAQHCSRFVIPQAERRFPVHDFHRGVDAESFLWNSAFARATERYGELPPKVKERLNREFREIVEAGLANAVVTLVRLHEEMENDGVQRGPGAGLFTNSVIASLLGLTRFDPLQFDLNFELSPGIASGSFPMLELSVPANQEMQAFDSLQRLFDGQVLPVGESRAWKTTAILDRLAGLLGKESSWVSQTNRSSAFQKAREAAARQPSNWMPDATLALDSPEVIGWLCARMEGRLRDYQLDTGLYVFTVDAIDTQIPARVIAAGEDGTLGLPVSEWSSEELGRLRHGRLSFTHPALLDLIGEATVIAREQGDPNFSPERTTSDDKLTYALLRKARTMGIEPLERPSLRRLLRESQPEDLHSAIRVLRAADGKSGLELSSILQVHVCASIKARHPAAFYAAALSMAGNNVRRLSALIDEVEEEEIPMAPIDINLSGWRWSYEKDMLRPGFMVVRGMTAAASLEIVAKRRELPFSDLADLCQRTERSQLRPAQIRSLVYAGALDDLAKSREELIAQLDVLLPNRSSRKGAEEELSFFDKDASWWVDQQAKAREERELTRNETIANATWLPVINNAEGTLRFLRSAKVRVPSLLTQKDSGRPTTLIGSLGPIESDEKGAITICDVGGCLVRATGPLAKRLADEELAGQRILFTGHLERQGNQWRLEAASIDRVEEAYRRATDPSELILDLSQLAQDRWKALLWLLKNNPGTTPIAMEWLPAEAPPILRSIASRKVLISPQLEYQLAKEFGEEIYRLRFLEHSELEARRNSRSGFVAKLSEKFSVYLSSFRRV